MIRRKSKHKTTKKSLAYMGITMKSKPEVLFAGHLSDLGLPWRYEGEMFKYHLPGRKYKPDFIVELPNNEVIYVEVKGWLRPEDRTKMIAVRDQHPEMDLRIVFVNSSKTINKGSKTTYGEWATKHCFKWSEKIIPQAWLKEEEQAT